MKYRRLSIIDNEAGNINLLSFKYFLIIYKYFFILQKIIKSDIKYEKDISCFFNSIERLCC